MSAKANILKRLRANQSPFENIPPIEQRQTMVNVDKAALLDTFVQRAKALSSRVLQTHSEEEALEYILKIIGEDKEILAWDYEYIPLASLKDGLETKKISIADSRDSNIRVGVTGVDAALAATGSIVVSAQVGRPRSVSLLPYIHIAILHEKQILPHFEAWIAEQSKNLAAFRKIGNHIVITGASRTADIAMELVLGAHGPAQLHLIVLT